MEMTGTRVALSSNSRRSSPKRSTTKPKAMVARPVRIHARKVRSEDGRGHQHINGSRKDDDRHAFFHCFAPLSALDSTCLQASLGSTIDICHVASPRGAVIPQQTWRQ